VVRGLFVRPGFVVFGGLTMMLGGLFVMMCCFVVVFVDFWHLYLPVNRFLTNLRLGMMEQRGSTSVSTETFPVDELIRLTSR
jgi:hypothetical protein